MEESIELNGAVDQMEDIPLYYSQRAIYGFSIVFSVIFGAVLLAQNISNNRNAKWFVIGYGILYTITVVLILDNFERSTMLTFVANAIGSSALTGFFWTKYLGKDVKFKAKPIWKPLIISFIITAPLVFLAIYSELYL